MWKFSHFLFSQKKICLHLFTSALNLLVSIFKYEFHATFVFSCCLWRWKIPGNMKKILSLIVSHETSHQLNHVHERKMKTNSFHVFFSLSEFFQSVQIYPNEFSEFSITVQVSLSPMKMSWMKMCFMSCYTILLFSIGKFHSVVGWSSNEQVVRIEFSYFRSEQLKRKLKRLNTQKYKITESSEKVKFLHTILD